MNIKRTQRKRRIKSKNMCPPCGNTGCYAVDSSPISLKIRERVLSNLCPGCGRNPCKCKRPNSWAPKNAK